jgi:hypothetical protein
MQQRADIMSQMRGAAGGSGIAALAQAMAGQGQLATQRASASIGMQEAKIQQLQRAEASRLQLQERHGEVQAEAMRLKGAETARGLEWQKTGTLLGMSQERVSAANQARAEAKAQQMGAIGDIASAGLSMATAGMQAKVPGSTGTGGNLGGLGLEGGGFSDPGFGQTISGGIQGPTIDQFGNTQFKDLSNLSIYK